MIASRRLASFFIALAASLLSGIAAAQAAMLPADAEPFPPYPKPCLIVVGDGNSSTVLPDAQADKGWVEIDRQVTSALVDALKGNGYATSTFFVEPAMRTDKGASMMQAETSTKCARLLQVAHLVGDEPSGPYFLFMVSLSHMVRSASEAGKADEFTVVSDFRRVYRYARTPAVMDTWHAGTFANTVFADLRSSGEAEFARLGSLPPLTGSALAAGSGPAAAASPRGVPAAPTCIVVSGGGGSKFADPRIDGFWLDVNREVTGNLVGRLQQGGYAVSEVFEELAERDQTPMKSMVALSRSGCAWMLQVTDDVSEDANGKFFAFDIALLRFVGADGGPPKRGQPARTVGDFKRRYRQPRTPEAMNQFNTGAFATTVFGDLQASGRIEFARTGVMPALNAGAPAPVSGDASTPVDPKLVARAYDAFVTKWPTLGAKEAHVRHILFASESDARAAIARIQGGAEFGAVARELSADQASRDQGGDLGWNLTSAFAPDVGRLVKSLEPKGLGAQPVHSALGWEVVEVLDVRPAPVPSFDAVKDKLETSLRAKLAARAAGTDTTGN